MQNVDTTDNNDVTKEIKTVEIDQNTQTSAMTGPTIVENSQVPTSQSTFGLDVSCSDDDEVSEVDSFILDTEDADPVLEPSFLLPQSMEGANLQTVTVDPETHARLEALLEAAGIGKLSTADGKALTDPEVLRKLTSSVSCALDEAAQALHRMRAEQQLGTIDSSRSLAEACSDGDVPTVRKLLREGGSVHETTEEGDSLLSLACSAGYYELAQVLLAMKANVEDRGIKGDCTPLMEAASGGYVDIVKLLISHGADVNAQSSAGNTPLHYGACGGYMDVVQVLIEAGANVEQHNENGHTPLMEAASAGHVSVASILLQAGAGINTHSNEFKESALTLACYKGHLDMVKFLLEAGADQEHKTDEMHTALMEASMDGHVEVAKLLLDSGAQVNMPADSFESPLTLAACGGHLELALLLIERGANLEEVNDEGYTPLMEAAREGHEEMVALLLAHGADQTACTDVGWSVPLLFADADINAQTEETQETALTLACCGGFLDVADFLFTAGADIELGCSTPLMEAAQEGHLELVKYLLKAKADVQAQTGTGDTALTYACENGHTDVAEVLLQHGAVLEHESEGGRTPLMKAARAGHLCTVQFLISKGADVNRQTSTNDHTVLSLACAGGHLAVVELLLAQGADPAHKLKDGSTMVIEAAKGGHTQVVKLLLEYPNRMLMNTQQDLPQITASDSHLVESRVPIHGLANIVPPSEPDSHPAKPNNLTTCAHADTAGVNRKANVAEMNIPIKPEDQILQNIQKSLTKKPPSTGANQGDTATKPNKNVNLTNSGEVSPQISENGELPDMMSDETIDLKATERLEAIISNVMAKELINTTSTREEQILRKQQILEELQKVERELQEKAQQQLLITAQHQLEQQPQQQQKQLQQALQASVSNKPLHKVLQKQLEEQGKKKLPLSSPTISSSSKNTPENQQSSGLEKQVPKSGDVSSTTASPTAKSNAPETIAAGGHIVEGGVADKQQQSRQNGEMNNGGLLSTNGGSQSTEHNGGSQSSQPPQSTASQTISQPKPQPQPTAQPTSQPQQAIQMMKPQPPSLPQPGSQPLVFNPPSLPSTMVQPAMIPPPKPPTLLPQQQQQQLDQQLLLQQQQQQQQQAVMPQFVLNETQRQTLQNLILRQQQEAQQLAQQASSLPFHQLQLTPQQQDQLFQVLSNQQISQQMLQQQQPQNLQQQQQQQQLQSLLQQQSTMTQQILNQQQQAQFLQQQQQAQFLQQQLQQIKPPVNPQKPTQRKTKNLLNMQQMNNQEPGMLGIDTVTPRSPPSTPLTPNPSPASPDSISPLYAPIDLDAQTESNHDTALTLACAGGHSELVTLLLSKGADIEHRDKKGFTPLILAATAGHVDVVEILLEHGADIEAQSERTKDTPLSLACSGGRYEVVELLLSKGANKEHRNVSDYTPLSLAASGGFVNIIKLLLSHGAEINSRTGSKLGISPLMLAAMNGHTAAVKLLLDMGSDINAQIETNKNTALTLACFQGRHEVVSLLVDRRAIIEHRAKTGLTPLMEAASGGYVEVGRVLLDKGADVNAPPVPSSRDTALTIAADKGHYRFVELLLSRHAAVDVKNKKGNSPLWLACHGGHLDVVQLIVTAGADIDSQDNRKVSCLMAAFRKGHIKVVKWMVKHVNQFPSDGDLSRYIATITDKELQKKCQQCMEIIVTAKDRQAAEANKNATNLLELLDKERQHEENKKAAAAKKREKKKKKKKEKQGKEKEDNNDSKNSTPEPESEDSQKKEPEEDKDDNPMILQPPTATTTSTLGLTLPTSDPIYSKAKNRNNKPEKRTTKPDTQISLVKPDKRNSKTDTQVMIVDNKPPKQDENKEPRNNKDVVNNKTAAKVTESRKNRKNRRDKENDRVPDMGYVADNTITVQAMSVGSVMSSGVEGNHGKRLAPSNKKKKGERFGREVTIGSATTAIGDLDDFGNLPSISEKDIEKLRKSVEKTKIGNMDKGGGHFLDKSHPEPNPNTLSVKTSPSLVNSPKRGQKKEDGWKEVIRKSKKIPVPASAISRVIGRGGCNINAIREVSGANIDVEKNKGSGERVITIKGSADATRQAHALISALVSDPDKELQEILPKTKTKQQIDKSLYFIPPNDTSNSQVGSSSQITGNLQSKSAKQLAPRLQAAQAGGNTSRSSIGGGGVMSAPIQVWGGPPTTTSVSPRRSNKSNSNPIPFSSPGPGINGSMMDKNVTRQLFSGEQKRKGFGSPNMISTSSVAMSGSAITKTTPSSPPNFNIRPDMRLSPGSRNLNLAKPLIPGSVKVLQRPNTVAGLQHQPLPIIPPNQPTTTATTQTITSSSSFNMSSSSGDYSPFDNLFNLNAAQQILGKKDDSLNERMNFASVAAAGVIPTFTGSPGMMPTTPVSPGGPSDPGLLAKAPGFKLPGPRMTIPDMAPGFKVGGFQMPPQMMEMNMSALYGLQNSQGLQGYSQNQSPNMSPRSSQSGSGMSPNSGYDSSLSSLQREEYSTPSQPMTLPKISSSLNPNAPDFMSRTAPPGSNTGPGGPGTAPNMPGMGMNPQTMYQQALAQQLLSAFNTMGPAPNQQPPGAPSPGPQNPDSLLGMGGQFNKQEFYQNMANLMQQWALQNQQPGSPVPGVGPSQGPGFTPPVPRAYSPLPAQGRPNSAPSIGNMPKEGPSPTPIGPPRTNSPLPPSTPPMPDLMRINEDRRQPRPIGGERSSRKAPGPGPLGVPGNIDFGDPLWNLSPQLSMDWNVKGTSPGLTSGMSSVMTTSVITGGQMSTNLTTNGDEQLDLDGHDPSRGLDDLSEQSFNPGLQSQGLSQIPLFNGVGPYPLQDGPGFGSSSIGGSGDGLQNMWNSLDTPDSEDITEKGMWNSWSK